MKYYLVVVVIGWDYVVNNINIIHFMIKHSKDIPSYQRQVHRITQPLFPWFKAKGNRISEDPARVSWYETELLIGQPNGGSPKLSKYQRG